MSASKPERAMPSNARQLESAVIRSAKVLIVDDEHYMRKVIRTLLLSVGVTDVHEVADGAHGLDAVAAMEPDVVIVDWQMAGMSGIEFVRRVRSPRTFAFPSVPIIMLTGHGEHWRVIEAMRLGAHEFLLKPVSGKALHARLASVLLKPRPMVKRGDYYGPAPRKMIGPRPEIEDALLDLDSQMQVQPWDEPEVDPSLDHVIFVS